jgi:hypothetical protein
MNMITEIYRRIKEPPTVPLRSMKLMPDDRRWNLSDEHHFNMLMEAHPKMKDVLQRPDKNCKQCNGLGQLGFNEKTNSYIPCPCVVKPLPVLRGWTCSNYSKHRHKHKIIAKACGYIQKWFARFHDWITDEIFDWKPR